MNSLTAVLSHPNLSLVAQDFLRSDPCDYQNPYKTKIPVFSKDLEGISMKMLVDREQHIQKKIQRRPHKAKRLLRKSDLWKSARDIEQALLSPSGDKLSLGFAPSQRIWKEKPDGGLRALDIPSRRQLVCCHASLHSLEADLRAHNLLDGNFHFGFLSADLISWKNTNLFQENKRRRRRKLPALTPIDCLTAQLLEHREDYPFVLQIDLKDAFGALPHNAIFSALTNLKTSSGIPLYSEADVKVLIALAAIHAVDPKTGIAYSSENPDGDYGISQGNPLSALLLNLTLESLLKTTQDEELEVDLENYLHSLSSYERSLEEEVEILMDGSPDCELEFQPNHKVKPTHKIFTYADDIYVMACSAQDCYDLWNTFKERFQSAGFRPETLREISTSGKKSSRIINLETDEVEVLKTYMFGRSNLIKLAPTKMEKLTPSTSPRAIRKRGVALLSRRYIKEMSPDPSPLQLREVCAPHNTTLSWDSPKGNTSCDTNHMMDRENIPRKPHQMGMIPILDLLTKNEEVKDCLPLTDEDNTRPLDHDSHSDMTYPRRPLIKVITMTTVRSPHRCPVPQGDFDHTMSDEETSPLPHDDHHMVSAQNPKNLGKDVFSSAPTEVTPFSPPSSAEAEKKRTSTYNSQPYILDLRQIEDQCQTDPSFWKHLKVLFRRHSFKGKVWVLVNLKSPLLAYSKGLIGSTYKIVDQHSTSEGVQLYLKIKRQRKDPIPPPKKALDPSSITQQGATEVILSLSAQINTKGSNTNLGRVLLKTQSALFKYDRTEPNPSLAKLQALSLHMAKKKGSKIAIPYRGPWEIYLRQGKTPRGRFLEQAQFIRTKNLWTWTAYEQEGFWLGTPV